MKKKLFVLISVLNFIFAFSQNVIEHNIYIQKLNHSSGDLYMNKNGNLIFFDKVYSPVEMKEGNLRMDDSIAFKNISISKNKYTYFIDGVYEKDTLNNNFRISKITLRKTINLKGLKKIVFKKIPSYRKVFDCNEKRYENILILKSFFLTHSFISEDNNSKKYFIKLIDENCEAVLEDEFDRNLLFSENKSFIILKNNEQIILIYDKYF